MGEQVTVELIRLIPTAIWAIVIILGLLTYRDAIRRQVLPRLTRFKGFGIEVEASVRENLDRVAESTPQAVGGTKQRTQVARRASRLADVLQGARVLMVNDVPVEMAHVVQLLHDLGIFVSIATSTEQAIRALAQDRFEVVNSDMRRGANVAAGIELIREMRTAGYHQPVILTVGSYEPEKGVPPFAFGITNRVDELLNLLFDALERLRV